MFHCASQLFSIFLLSCVTDVHSLHEQHPGLQGVKDATSISGSPANFKLLQSCRVCSTLQLKLLAKLLVECTPKAGWQTIAHPKHRPKKLEKDVASLDFGLVLPKCSRRQLLLSAPAIFGARSAGALEDTLGPSVKSEYDKFAATYDEDNDGLRANLWGIPEMREKAVKKCRGRTLEVGCGTGINLRYYNDPKVTSLQYVDLSAGMLAVAEDRAKVLRQGGQQLPPVDFKRMSVTRLEFEDNTFDTVLDCWGLCVYPDPEAAIAEMKRVLKPGGQLVFLEAKRYGIPVLDQWLSILAKLGAALSNGWAVDAYQDVVGLIQKANLRVVYREDQVAGLLGLFVTQLA